MVGGTIFVFSITLAIIVIVSAGVLTTASSTVFVVIVVGFALVMGFAALPTGGLVVFLLLAASTAIFASIAVRAG